MRSPSGESSNRIWWPLRERITRTSFRPPVFRSGGRVLGLPAPEAADDVGPARVALSKATRTSSPTSGRK